MLSLVVVLACVPRAVSGQAIEHQPQAAEQPRFRSAATDLVVLAATVSGRDGGFVDDLDQSRFQIYDDEKPHAIQFFSNEDVPVSVGLIIDSSGSMRPKMGDVVAAAMSFAQSSHPRDELFVLAFDDAVHELLDGRRFLLASDVDALETALVSIRPQGQTSLYDAIISGLDRLAEGSRARKVLIVMSDGGDNASRATLDDVVDRARRSDASIYTIGLFNDSDRDRNPGVLEKLANATGGERFLPHSTSPLLIACRQIARDIRSAYTLAFEPSVFDGKYHRLRVTVDAGDGRRVSVRTRPGYVAAERPAPGIR
jgi:Ca-activated chloride channel homolog